VHTLLAECTLLEESNHLLVGVCTLLAEISNAVEKLSINRGIQAIYCAHYIKIPTVSAALHQPKWHQIARQTLGDFHINLQLPLSHIRQSQFQQGIVQEIIQQFGPTQIALFELRGEIGMSKWHVLAIKQSIKELKHLTYFTDYIIVHRVQCSQCCNLRGRWIQATYATNAAFQRESCEDQ
jgi:hypothetical protein